MFIKLCRMSGFPLEQADADSRRLDFQQAYDSELEARGGDIKKLDEEAMKDLTDALTKADDEIIAKYPTEKTILYPFLPFMTKKLFDHYGCPVAFIRDDTGELRAVIQDTVF